MLVRAGTHPLHPTPRAGFHIINFTFAYFLAISGEEGPRLAHNGHMHCQDASFASPAQPTGNVEIFAWVADASHAPVTAIGYSSPRLTYQEFIIQPASGVMPTTD